MPQRFYHPTCIPPSSLVLHATPALQPPRFHPNVTCPPSPPPRHCFPQDLNSKKRSLLLLSKHLAFYFSLHHTSLPLGLKCPPVQDGSLCLSSSGKPMDAEGRKAHDASPRTPRVDDTPSVPSTPSQHCSVPCQPHSCPSPSPLPLPITTSPFTNPLLQGAALRRPQACHARLAWRDLPLTNP